MSHIVFIGSDLSACSLFANMLLELSGPGILLPVCPPAQHQEDKWYHFPVNDGWQTFFTAVLKGLTQHMEKEVRREELIVTGGVLYHLAVAEAAMKQFNPAGKTGINRGLMFAGLKRVLLEYAQKHYACIIHVADGLLPLTGMDRCITHLLDEVHVKRLTIDPTEALEETRQKITLFLDKTLPCPGSSRANK